MLSIIIRTYYVAISIKAKNYVNMVTFKGDLTFEQSSPICCFPGGWWTFPPCVFVQGGVHRGRHAHQQLPHDRETLLPQPAAQELRLQVRLLHAEQQEHVRAHLRVPRAVWGNQWAAHTHTQDTPTHTHTHTGYSNTRTNTHQDKGQNCP